jgi:hypothetical protein
MTKSHDNTEYEKKKVTTLLGIGSPTKFFKKQEKVLGCGKRIYIGKGYPNEICGLGMFCKLCQGKKDNSPLTNTNNRLGSRMDGDTSNWTLDKQFERELKRYCDEIPNTEAWCVTKRLQVDVRLFLKKLKEELSMIFYGCKDELGMTDLIINKLAGQSLCEVKDD